MSTKNSKIQFPTTDLNYYADNGREFPLSVITTVPSEAGWILDSCGEYDIPAECIDFNEQDFNLMVDMCRVDDYFDDCYAGWWHDLDIDPTMFIHHVWQRTARLAHTFWGIQSHFAALGIDSDEDLSIDFVKRAVSELIKRENEARGESAKLEKARLAELSGKQAE